MDIHMQKINLDTDLHPSQQLTQMNSRPKYKTQAIKVPEGSTGENLNEVGMAVTFSYSANNS